MIELNFESAALVGIVASNFCSLNDSADAATARSLIIIKVVSARRIQVHPEIMRKAILEDCALQLRNISFCFLKLPEFTIG